jgi:AcrR family transcriptional regulator
MGKPEALEVPRVAAYARAMPSAPGPQRRAEAAQARDRRVLAAARRCFATGGFEGTTMEKVAREAEVAVGTLYLRAATKEALLARVLDDVECELAEAMDAAAQDVADWTGRFGAVFRALLQAVAGMSDLPVLMRLAHHAAASRQAEPGPIRRWIAEFIRTGQAAGALRPVDPELAAAMAFGMVEGAMQAHAHHAHLTGAAVAEVLADTATRWLLQPRE